MIRITRRLERTDAAAQPRERYALDDVVPG